MALVSRTMDQGKLHNLVPQGLTGFAVVINGDLTREQDCERVVGQALHALGGKLDVLVNAAGATRLGCGIANTTMAELQWHLDVNLKAAFMMTQRCIPALEASRGCVVNVGSIASERPIPHCLPFCVSKAAFSLEFNFFPMASFF